MISVEQREQFRRDGYIVIPGVVDQPAVDAALQGINHWFVDGFDTTKLSQYHSQSFAPDLQGHPSLVGLLTDSSGFEMATELVGAPLVRPKWSQIALRFPVPPGEAPGDAGAHLDGIPTADNGVPYDGRIHGFSLLAGVLLSDVPDAGHGNLTVWPGSHLAMARWFAEHGNHVEDPNAFFQMNHRLAAESGQPVAITGRAGDLVLAHYLLLHGVGGHAGPGIRYAVFFRLVTVGHDSFGDDVLTDPWTEWPAFRPSVSV